MPGDRSRCDEQTRTALGESLEQGAVVKLTDDPRMQTLTDKPFLEACADRHIVARKKKGRSLQQGREVARELGEQRIGTEDGEFAFRQQVAESAHVEVGRHRLVGDHDIQPMYGEIQPMYGEFAEQRRQSSFAANQAYRFRQTQDRFDQTMSDHLRH